jgi:hypothetical protein
MSLAIRATLDQLQDWAARVQNAIKALQDLEDAGVLPKGTMVLPPARPLRTPVFPKPSPKPNAAEAARGTKTCTKCGKTKAISEFSSGGKKPQCKQCVREYQKAWQAAKKKHECKICHAKFRSSDTLVEHEKMRHAS